MLLEVGGTILVPPQFGAERRRTRAASLATPARGTKQGTVSAVY